MEGGIMKLLRSSLVAGAAVAMATLAAPAAAATDSFLVAKDAAQKIERIVERSTLSMVDTADRAILMLEEAHARGVPIEQCQVLALGYERILFGVGMHAIQDIRSLGIYTTALLNRLGVRPGVLARFEYWVDKAQMTVAFCLNDEMLRIEAALARMG
jgi:hypothetical protein